MKKCNIIFENPNKDNKILLNELVNALAESMIKLDEKFVFVQDTKEKVKQLKCN